MFNEKNNTTNKRTINEGIKLDELEFMSLKQFIGIDLHIWGYFFTNSKLYGKSVCVVTEGAKVNLPKRYVEEFESLTDEEREAIVNGKCLLKNIRAYQCKNGTTTVTFDWCDFENC